MLTCLSLRVCVYAHMSIPVCVCVCVCVYAHMSIPACVCVCVCVCAHMSIPACVCRLQNATMSALKRKAIMLQTALNEMTNVTCNPSQVCV
jgi:hypothetical protein